MITAIEERLAQQPVSSTAEAYRNLRECGLTAFGEMLFELHPRSNGYEKHLPRMASEEAQVGWTGGSGPGLLAVSVGFVRALMAAYVALTGRSPGTARILDYGCGYGRLAPLCYFFTDPQNVYGVDPWDESIRICRDRGLGTNFVQSDFVPTSLPVEGQFDLIYAFSVFTHLSRKTAIQVLSTLRRYCAPNGVLCITIRPKEFWHIKPDVDAGAMIATHDAEGFAFIPIGLPPIDGDITYGDASMSLDWLTQNAIGWKIAGLDYSPAESHQLYVFMVPA